MKLYANFAEWLSTSPVAETLEAKRDEWAFAESTLLRWHTGDSRPKIEYQLNLAALTGVKFAFVRGLLGLPCTPAQSWLVAEIIPHGGVSAILQKAEEGDISPSLLHKYLDGYAVPSMERCAVICELIARVNPTYPVADKREQIYNLILAMRSQSKVLPIGQAGKTLTKAKVSATI
jgi:hypothetical protein